MMWRPGRPLPRMSEEHRRELPRFVAYVALLIVLAVAVTLV